MHRVMGVEGGIGMVVHGIGRRARCELPSRCGDQDLYGVALRARAFGGGKRTARRALWSCGVLNLRPMSMRGCYSTVVDTHRKSGIYAMLDEGR